MGGCSVSRGKVSRAPAEEVQKNLDATQKPLSIPKNARVALVLGAGGSRAMVHVGILEVLEEAKIPIDFIVGSSGGSIVGALYADDPNAHRLKNKLMHAKYKDFIDTSIFCALQAPIRPKGLIQGSALKQYLKTHLKSRYFSDLQLPFIAVATDLHSNQIQAFNQGRIAEILHASSALPPIFTPVHINKHMYVDGGVLQPVPVQIARKYKPKLVIAVDISTPPPDEAITNAFNLTSRVFHLSYYELSRLQSKTADVSIHPNLSGFGTFEDTQNNKLYQIGREAAQKALPEILRKLGS